MPDYAAMYKKLFQSQTRAIQILQEAQQETEEMYISAPDSDIESLGTTEQAHNADVKNETDREDK